MAAKTSKPSDKSKTVAPPAAPRRAGFAAAQRPAGQRRWQGVEALDERPGGRRQRPADGVANEDSPRHYRLNDLSREGGVQCAYNAAVSRSAHREPVDTSLRIETRA